MCPKSRTHIFEKIANDADLPEAMRTSAKARLEAEKEAIKVIKANAGLEGKLAPSTGNGEFKFRIYSMGNWMPDKTVKYEGKDEPYPGEPHPPPGILVQDSAGFVVRDEDGNVMQDVAREKCVTGLRATYDLYKQLGRKSLDDNGGEIVASIHLPSIDIGAYWWVDQMFFGDGGVTGRGELMPGVAPSDDLTTWLCAYDLDTIGHELTHGVISKTADLTQKEIQADTLNESIADCFGMLVKMWAMKLKVEDSDWDISPGWWAESTVKAKGWTKNYCRTFRKAADHEGDPESKKMSEWKVPINDDPHTNCGIPNHAFYTAACEFGGYAWEHVGRYWYAALTDAEFKRPEKQNFKGFAELTCRHAGAISGPDAEAIVRKAWATVEVL
ncbi:hypothetical protein N0V83_005614 [Neocucurbitaria cava]|uniref:Uncharacterized protein n=1 Tax=Neocucurbitaria cava TaxID=798079 RepID=A0A9W9CM74_9PLEO|nr:hypothetical protein N0V83_005614 [Neocucurbitaria cava]